MSKNNFKFIDLFAGVGGFHLALESLGGKCVLASEIDKFCQQTYSENFPDTNLQGDIYEINKNPNDIPDHDVLCAGFPCQPFSKGGHRLGFEDTRGTLFYEIAKIVEHKRPEYLMLENVPNLVGHDNGNTWNTISTVLSDLGYIFTKLPIKFSPHLIGVPQFRERVFILAKNQKDYGHDSICNVERPTPPLPECSIYNVLQNENEIDDVDKYKLKDEEVDRVNMWNDFINIIDGPLPGFPIWADQFRETYDVSDFPKWKKNFLIKNRKLYLDNKKGLDRWFKKYNDLKHLAQTHTKLEWQAGNSERDIWKLIFHFRPSGLRVKRPNYVPALVAMTHTSIIGKYKRKITPREAARLQSFPDNYILHSDNKQAYKQFGNAVNVDVIKYLASELLKINYEGKVLIEKNQEKLFD